MAQGTLLDMSICYYLQIHITGDPIFCQYVHFLQLEENQAYVLVLAQHSYLLYSIYTTVENVSTYNCIYAGAA